MPSKHPIARKILSWCVLTLGTLIGLAGLVITTQANIDTERNSHLWLESRLEAAGIGLLGLLFVVASFVALGNRRRAGLLFFAASPIAAFILAYRMARFWVPATSGAYYRLPDLAPAIVLACIFFAPFYAPLMARRSWKRAVCLFVGFASLFGLAVTIWENTSALLLPLAGWWGLFIVFGTFWFATYKLDWSPVGRTEPKPWNRRMATIVIESISIAVLVLAGTFAFIAFRARPVLLHDCSGTPLFWRPLSTDHAVFTARLIRAGHVQRVAGKWAGTWAIGWIEQTYWGLPSWTPRLAFITNGVFLEGETFFITGRRADGLLTQFLPIVNTQGCVGGAAPVAKAEMYQRLIGKTLRANEVHFIGYVYRPLPLSDAAKQRPTSHDSAEIYDLMLNPAGRREPLERTRIAITGSTGTRIVTADEKGIYEVDLAPDDYTITPVDLPRNFIAVERKLKKRSFEPGAVLHLDFPLEWDGTIQGTVRDAAGHPTQVSVELQNPDGTELGRSSTQSLLARDKSGTFRFAYLPSGGRYIVMVNPFGPYKDSPFAPTYYPAAGRLEDARVLKIKPEASQVNDVNFTVSRLEERKLSVHVAWPNGQAIYDAAVLVAYEHTRCWDDLSRPCQSWSTDYSGVAEIQLFGEYHVRVFAQKFIAEKNSAPWGSPRYSPVVELDTAGLPKSVDLMVSSRKLIR